MIQRFCRFCGYRLRGNAPGAMTILLDGQPLDASIVICPRHAIQVQQVLETLRQHSAVAQRAQALDVTTQLRPVGDALTEHFAAVPREAWRRPPRVLADATITEISINNEPSIFPGVGPPVVVGRDAQAEVPLPPRNHRRRLGGWRRPQDSP